MHDSTPSFRLSERATISVMAQSGLSETSARLSAFGVKRTSGETATRFKATRMTQLGHEGAAFAAMHGPDLLYFP